MRGFSLNSEGHEQLNYDVIKKNVLAEVRHPLEQPGETQVVKTYQIERDANAMRAVHVSSVQKLQIGL